MKKVWQFLITEMRDGHLPWFNRVPDEDVMRRGAGSQIEVLKTERLRLRRRAILDVLYEDRLIYYTAQAAFELADMIDREIQRIELVLA